MRSNFTTVLLVIIVLVLISGLGLSVYYVFNMSQEANADTKDVQNTLYKEEEEKIDKMYDMTKRNFEINIKGSQFNMLIGKDGKLSVNINEDNILMNKIKTYNSIKGKYISANITGVVRAYEVITNNLNDETIVDRYKFVTIIVVKDDGSIYKLDKYSLYEKGIYNFTKVEAIKDIAHIEQVNKGDDKSGFNVIAIDNNQNEILLNSYLIEE